MSVRFLKITSISALLAFSFVTNAQDASNTYAINRTGTASHTGTPEAVPVINSSAVKNFSAEFGDLVNESWSANGAGTRARFQKSGVTYLIDYDKNGKWLNTLRVYQAQELPVMLQKLVNANYPGYSILTTNELSTAEGQVYFVQVQNETSLKTLSIVEGEIKAVKNYNRADK